MNNRPVAWRTVAMALLSFLMACCLTPAAMAQEQPPEGAAAATEQAPDPLDEDELEVLVARIALYPDELVAVISGASLYPLQIVEAARFLDKLRQGQDAEAQGHAGTAASCRCSTIPRSSR